MRGTPIGAWVPPMLLGLASNPIAAQVPVEPSFTVLDMRAGLSQGSVEALVRDRNGFLWVGTRDGLNRYDGVGFRTYRHHRDDTTTLGDNFIRTLAESADGRLWVGTERAGLDLFDPLTGEVARFPMAELGPWLSTQTSEGDSRSGRTVRAIVEMPDRSLLLQTDVGLVSFDPASARAKRVEAPEIPTAVCSHSEGGAVVGFGDGGLARVRDSGTPITVVTHLEGRVTALRCGREGGYAATESGNVYTLDLGSLHPGRLTRLESDAGSGLVVRDVLPLPDGSVWMTTPEGVFGVRPGDVAPRRVGGGERRGSIPEPDATKFLLDDSGVLWIGTWNGLASAHPLTWTIHRVLNRREDAGGLTGAGVVAIESGTDGDVWIGTIGGGVQRMRVDWARRESMLESPAALSELADAQVFDLVRGGAGELWIATLNRGVARLDASRRHLDRFPIEDISPASATIPVYSLFVDRQGDTWAGTQALGLLKLDTTGRRFARAVRDHPWFNPGSLYVWPIVEDSSGSLWVGAVNGGLSAISPDRTSHRRYTVGPRGLSDDRILTLYAGPEGYIWIGTQGGGLNRLDPRTDEITVFTTEDGLPHDNVQAVVEDDLGYLWVSTNDGLARRDPETGEWRVFKEAVGLAGNRFFANAVHKAESGHLFFGGEDGLTIIDPSRIVTRGVPPPVALTAFHVHGREQPLARPLAEGGLDLAPAENFFTFEFAALDFTDVTLNRYRYRLEGLDDDWIDAGSRPVANYTSVPRGRRYTFRVAARNSEGIWNEAGLAIPVRIRAPYYQTWWFRSSAAAAVLLLITGLYAYRLRELQRRQELRLRIAGELHDDIGANLSAIALKADMVLGAPVLDERRRAQLGDVGRLAREAALKVRETVWVVNTRYDTLRSLAGKMRDTADTILAGQVALRFTAPEELPEREIGMELRQNLHLLFKEALHNVVKHADATAVDVEVGWDAPWFWFRVRDDGVGFSPGISAEGSGQDLMRKRAAKHGGELVVSSRPGEGTTVELRVRVK